VSRKRQRARIPDITHYFGVNWLDKPVPLMPGSKTLVHGCTADAPFALLAWWQRESKRYHNTIDREAA
jgi:hypothetical protein